jgi:HAD superfamily hydrolase (TIGR01509 family)
MFVPPIAVLRFDRFGTVLFDVDGTLIDSNGAHAEAWAAALRAHGCSADVQQIRRFIGKGADRLLPEVAGVSDDSALGRGIAARKRALFAAMLPSLQPTRGARALLEFLRGRGLKLAVTTSAGDDEAHAILERAGVADLLPDRVTKDDAAESKPAGDIVQAALEQCRTRPEAAVLVGDTPYDLEAAARAGVRAIALRCGGYWADADLRSAIGVYDDPEALLTRWRAYLESAPGEPAHLAARH